MTVCRGRSLTFSQSFSLRGSTIWTPSGSRRGTLPCCRLCWIRSTPASGGIAITPTWIRSGGSASGTRRRGNGFSRGCPSTTLLCLLLVCDHLSPLRLLSYFHLTGVCFFLFHIIFSTLMHHNL